MSSIKDKYQFYSKDCWNSFFYRTPLIKRNKEYNEKFAINEIKLRSRSTIYKAKPNDNFSIHHIFVCLTKCKKVCKLEDFKVRKIPTAIEGLNSDKVDDYLFSSQRLTNKLIKQYDLINKLKQLNVGLIVNCEEEGEHPYCGTVYTDGLDENGYAYSTKELEKNGIHVLKCGWVDFVAPDSFNHMIKIVKEMYHYIHSLNKKVIVHCHAGMGRTGTSLACYKIFEKKINAEEARKEIRVGTRKNCLAGGKQYIFCQEFEKYLELLRENFFQKNKKDVTIFKINEKLLDVGNYQFKYFNDNNYIKYVPIFLLYIFDGIIHIKKEKNIDTKIIGDFLVNKENTDEEENKIKELIKQINNYNWEVIYKCEDIKILGKILFKWLNNSINYVLQPKEITSNNYDKLKDSSKWILNCISKFLILLESDKKENSDYFKKFIDDFIPSLLGYSISEINDKNKQELINKLKEIIKQIKNN